MNGSLIDTNVVVRVLNGDIELAKYLSGIGKVYVSSIVLGELLYGAEKSAKIDFNKRNAINFCSNFAILEVEENISATYGKIKAELERAGKIIPENDMWIAATAIANDLTLISQDKHMENVEALKFIKR